MRRFNYHLNRCPFPQICANNAIAGCFWGCNPRPVFESQIQGVQLLLNKFKSLAMTITESLGEKWGGGLSYERRHLRICICIYGLSSRAGTVLARHLKFKSQRRWKRISIFPFIWSARQIGRLPNRTSHSSALKLGKCIYIFSHEAEGKVTQHKDTF